MDKQIESLKRSIPLLLTLLVVTAQFGWISSYQDSIYPDLEEAITAYACARELPRAPEKDGIRRSEVLLPGVGSASFSVTLTQEGALGQRRGLMDALFSDWGANPEDARDRQFRWPILVGHSDAEISLSEARPQYAPANYYSVRASELCRSAWGIVDADPMQAFQDARGRFRDQTLEVPLLDVVVPGAAAWWLLVCISIALLSRMSTSARRLEEIGPGAEREEAFGLLDISIRGEHNRMQHFYCLVDASVWWVILIMAVASPSVIALAALWSMPFDVLRLCVLLAIIAGNLGMAKNVVQSLLRLRSAHGRQGRETR